MTLQTDYTYDTVGNRLTRNAGGALETLAYDAFSNRLETVTAGATVPDASVFSSGRQFAASLGLVPRQHSTGGKPRLGGISKRGDGYLRRLLMTGATAALRRSKETRARPWVQEMLRRRPAKVVAVALANKTARTAWALMMRGETYRAPGPAAG